MERTLLNRSGNATSASEVVLERVLAGASFDEALDEGALARMFGFEKPKQKGRMLRPEDGPILAHHAHDATKIINRQQGAGGYEYWDSHNPDDLPVYKPTWMNYRAQTQESKDIAPARVGDVMDALKSRPPIGTRVEVNVHDCPGHVLNGKRGTVVSYCAWEGSNNVGVELDGRYDPDGPSYWGPDDLLLVNEAVDTLYHGMPRAAHARAVKSGHLKPGKGTHHVFLSSDPEQAEWYGGSEHKGKGDETVVLKFDRTHPDIHHKLELDRVPGGPSRRRDVTDFAVKGRVSLKGSKPVESVLALGWDAESMINSLSEQRELNESAAVLYHHYYYGPNAVHNRRALDKDTESDIEQVLRTSPYA